MIAEHLSVAANVDRLEALLETTCNGVPAGPAREALLAYARQKRDGMVALAAALHAADDEPELVRLLAAVWLELRCEWERYNNVSNYQLFHSGHDAEPQVMAAAATMSGMLTWIEEVVPGPAVELMTVATLDMLDRIRADVVERALTAGTAA